MPEILAELKLAPGSRTRLGEPGLTPAARTRRDRRGRDRRRPRPRAGRAAVRHRAVDIRAAGEVLAPLARRCGTDLERFLTEVSLGAEVDALDPRADAITLLTMHAAKGLEFEVVFLAGCEDGLLPLRTPGSGLLPGTDLAEERRLLFVGDDQGPVTAAAQLRRAPDPARATAPAGASPFLQAIGSGSWPAGPRAAAPAGRARQLRLL